MDGFELVATVAEFDQLDRKEVIVDDVPVLLVKVTDQFYAIEDVCTHDGQPLSDGPIEGCEIICSRHGAKFDLASGKALCMPATEAVPTYEVQIKDDQIWLREN